VSAEKVPEKLNLKKMFCHFLNPSGDGMEIETFDDEGKTDTDAKRQLQTNADGEVYRFSFW
jgi:hypothetical protein